MLSRLRPETHHRRRENPGARASGLLPAMQARLVCKYRQRPVLFEPAPDLSKRRMIGRRLFLSKMSEFDYMSRRWLRLRTAVLRDVISKDGAPICQWSKRFGRRVEATHVHHIWPAEDYPEFAWARWNLIALSQASHNAMHDRATGKLTAAGENLRRRTIPPSSSASRPPSK